MVATWPIAVDKYLHEKFLTIFVKYLLFIFLISKIVITKKQFEYLIGAFLLGQFYISWVAHSMGRTGQARLENLAGSDTQDANSAAALVATAIPILINYLIIGKKWQKCCSLIIMVFVFNALVLINSRGAFLGLVVASLYYFGFSLLSPAFATFKKYKIIIVLAVGIAGFFYMADQLFWERMATVINPAEEGYTGRERTFFWLTTFDMVRDHPFGAGAFGYQALSPLYLPLESLSSTQTRAVHSMYFQVLAEYGYHGFAIFMVFLFSVFKFSRRIKKDLIRAGSHELYYTSIALEASFLVLIISGVFISILYVEALYWLAAFIGCYNNICSNSAKHINVSVQTKEVEQLA